MKSVKHIQIVKSEEFIKRFAGTSKLYVVEQHCFDHLFIDKHLVISDSGILRFRNCEFKRISHIDQFIVDGILQFIDCKFTAQENYGSPIIQFRSNNKDKINSVLFENCQFEHSIALRVKGHVKLEISKTISQHTLYIEGDDAGQPNALLERVQLKEAFFGHHMRNLWIKGDHRTDHFSQFYVLDLSDVRVNEETLIDHIKVEKRFSKKDDFSDRMVRITRSYFAGVFDFSNSNLSRVTFNALDFDNKTQINLAKSLLKGMTLANISWPKGHELNQDFSKEGKDQNVRGNLELREVYRQLKLAALDNQDRLDAQKFFRNEMQSYLEALKRDRSLNRMSLNDYWNLALKVCRLPNNYQPKVRIENPSSRFLMRIDAWVSDFGQNYWKPLGWLVLFHFLFLSFLWNFDYFGNKFTGDVEMGYFFSMLNPAHDLPDFVRTGPGKMTDFFMRISSAFFIFHFLKATRRFGKMN